jgi:SAM-dependent methyltransferase
LDEISRCLKPGGFLILTVPYDKRVRVLPVVDLMIKMPASVQRMLAPHYIEGTSSYEEAIWKLKRERFQEIRNYSLDDIKKKLAKSGLELIEYENNLKFFGAMCWELIAGLRIFHFTRALDLAFPVMYPISLLDELLPVHWRGEEMAVKARKRRSENGND